MTFINTYVGLRHSSIVHSNGFVALWHSWILKFIIPQWLSHISFHHVVRSWCFSPIGVFSHWQQILFLWNQEIIYGKGVYSRHAIGFTGSNLPLLSPRFFLSLLWRKIWKWACNGDLSKRSLSDLVSLEWRSLGNPNDHRSKVRYGRKKNKTKSFKFL